MTEQARKYLIDILAAIGLVEEFLVEIADFEEYIQDAKTQSAVERQLIIIGEAVNKFSKEMPEITMENFARIVSFRNRLTHNYDGIDQSIVWAVLRMHLPQLKMAVERMLSGTH